jgi:ATP-binding cassette, subfamily A (ABC1), member 3
MNEKSMKTKHLQIVAGVDRMAYWTSIFVWDVACYQITLWLVVTMLLAFNVEPFSSSGNDILTGVILLLMLHGPAAAGYSYCLTHAFSSASDCHLFLVVSGFFIGIGGKSFYTKWIRSIFDDQAQ